MLPVSTLVLFFLALLPQAAVSSVTSASKALGSCVGADRSEAVFTKCYECFNQNWNGSYFEDYSCDEINALDCEAYGKCSAECLTQDKCGKSLEETLLATYRVLTDYSKCPLGCTQTFSAEGNDLNNILSSGAWTLAVSPILAFLVLMGGLTV
jgi:hypothetical protein